MEDGSIRSRIGDLVEEERILRDRLSRHEVTPDEEQAQLRSLEVELDQCWDLLRQRAAKREFGADPESAEVRPPGIVEGYAG